ncbi:MAG: glycosyltransferase [Halioglobus sp.]
MADSAAKSRVTVCVANYNGAQVIAQCLQSIEQQQGAAHIDVIVHDDASTDDSLAIIRDQFPQVTLLTSEHNIGFCLANNKMVAAAQGNYLLLLNNDAWLAPDAVATLLAAAGRRGDGIFTLPQLAASDSALLDCGMFMDLFANAVPIAQRVEQPVAMVMGACLWVSRDLWDDCGGFPDWFDSMAEDMYLCNYARLRGADVVALETSSYHHHVGHSFGGGKVVSSGLSTGLSTTVKRRRLSERNKLYVLFLFYPWPAWLLMLPLQVLALLVEGLALSLAKRDLSLFSRIYGHAVLALLTNWPKLWRERRLIQARRRVGMRAFFSVYRWLPYKLQMLLRHGVPELR